MKIAKLKNENSSQILHVDGDSFFASVETSLNHKLKGKPVVTGGERGIASAMSREAKALGVSRGMPIYQIRKLFPQVVIQSSDYLNYSIFAERMYSIVGRYCEHVEPYSIDECFAIIENPKLVSDIKKALQKELGLTFSLGLADTKVLAKIASSRNKPDGLTILGKGDVEKFLKTVPIGAVWGIGPATARHLRSFGLETAFDLYARPLEWGREHLNKSTLSIWHELHGERIDSLHDEEDLQKSIQSTETFRPFSSNREVLLAEISKNTENASVKSRREGLVAKRVSYFLKTKDFRYDRFEFHLPTPTNNPSEIMNFVKKTFSKIFRPRVVYRATGITLADLVPIEATSGTLFAPSEENKLKGLYKAIDRIERRYGSHTLVLASSLEAYKRSGGPTERRLYIPFLGEVS